MTGLPDQEEVIKFLESDKLRVRFNEKEFKLKEESLGVLKQYVEKKIEILEKLQYKMKGNLYDYKNQENEKKKVWQRLYEFYYYLKKLRFRPPSIMNV